MARSVGLRTEIIVNLVLLMGAAMIFVGLLLIKLSENEMLSQRVDAARKSALVLAHGAAEALGRPPGAGSAEAAARRFLSSLPAETGVEHWWLVDRDLQLLAASAERDGGPVFDSSIRYLLDPQVDIRYPGRWLPLQELGPSDLQISVPLRAGGRFLGALQLRFSLQPLRDRIDGTQRLFFVFVFLYGVILVFFGVFFLGRTVVTPIRRLLQATREVRGGNLDASLPVEGPTEIAELAGSFNGMIGALRESRRETRSHIRSLEDANAALRQTRRELLRSERMASVGHLAAGMAHEVGNPLGAMVGYLELLRADLRDPAAVDLVGRTLAEAERIDRLVRDLLDFAAPARGAVDPAEPGQVLREAHSLLERQGKFEGLAVELDIAAELPQTTLDGHKLQQVIVNLLLNACDATPDGGRIALSAARVADGVQIEVADSGSGMSEELQTQVFDPFFSTKPEGQGRGLGLTICHRIVEEAGGRIDIESEPGRGSRFRMILPAAGGGDDD